MAVAESKASHDPAILTLSTDKKRFFKVTFVCGDCG